MFLLGMAAGVVLTLVLAVVISAIAINDSGDDRHER